MGTLPYRSHKAKRFVFPCFPGHSIRNPMGTPVEVVIIRKVKTRPIHCAGRNGLSVDQVSGWHKLLSPGIKELSDCLPSTGD